MRYLNHLIARTVPIYCSICGERLNAVVAPDGDLCVDPCRHCQNEILEDERYWENELSKSMWEREPMR